MNNQLVNGFDEKRRKTIEYIASQVLIINFLVFLTMIEKVDGKLYIHLALNVFILMELNIALVTAIGVKMQNTKDEYRKEVSLYLILILMFILILFMAYIVGKNDWLSQSIRIPFLPTEILLLALWGGIQLILRSAANR